MPRISLLCLLFLLPSLAFSKRYTVLGDRVELPYDKSTTQSYVLEGEELQSSGTINQALSKVPGLFISQSGAYGGNTTYFMRGLGRGQVKVLIDGIEINDPTDIDRSVQLQHFAVSNIERIEVLKGASGALYGADSSGGVILITTKKDLTSTLSASYGSHETWGGGFYTSAKQGDWRIRASGDLVSSEGISAYNSARVSGNAEKDFYKRSLLNLGLANPSVGLNFNVKSVNAKADIDSSLSGDIVNGDLSRYDHMIYSIGHEAPLRDGLWLVKTDIAYSTIERDVQTNHFEGETLQAKIEAKLLYSENQALVVYSDYTADEMQASSEFSDKNQESFGLGLTHHHSHKTFFFDQSLRIDKAQAYASKLSGRLGLGKNIDQNQTVKLQIATGFKAPTLYQRFSSYGGDQDLRATKSLSTQLSYSRNVEGLISEATVFNNDVRNAIDYDLTTSSYKNIGKTNTYGIEISNTWTIEKIKLLTNYTWQRARNELNGADLARQPRWFGTFGIGYEVAQDLSLDFSHEAVSKRDDSGKLPYYDTYNLQANWSHNKALFNLSLKNIFDREYESVRYYAPAGRTITLAASWSL
tara:strand:+ start:6280 stop:8031 length:1752 start_codon:yes stop_codon:yes gene_type:complete